MSNQSCPTPKEGPMTIDELVTSLEAEIKLLEDHIRMIEDGKIQDPCPECRKKDLVQRKRQLDCIRAMYSDLTDLNHGILRILRESTYHTDRGVYHFGVNEGKDFIMLHISVKGKENADKVKAWLREAES